MSTGKDDLGDRMKIYEAVETHRRFDPMLPVYARIDGRSFSKFTRKMERPFDIRMTTAMIETTKYLVDKTHASIGYIQSDEISLVWDGSPVGTKLFFDGKIQKCCSVLASMAAARFAVAYAEQFGGLSKEFPHFDCRIIQMPNRTEAANMMLWRELDAQKNSVSMAARSLVSHKILQGKKSPEMISILSNLGHDIDQYPVSFRRGTWLQRVVENKILSSEELALIPEEHRPESGSLFQRSSVKIIDMPRFVTVKNREAVIFDQATPIVTN